MIQNTLIAALVVARIVSLALSSGLIYMRARPIWIRCSNLNNAPPEINEFPFPSA
jgi:hypothetical protein